MPEALGDLHWLVAAGWDVAVAAGERDGIADIYVKLDELADGESAATFWGGVEEGLAQARAYSEQQGVTP